MVVNIVQGEIAVQPLNGKRRLVVNVVQDKTAVQPLNGKRRLVVNVVQDETAVQRLNEIEGGDLWQPLRMGQKLTIKRKCSELLESKSEFLIYLEEQMSTIRSLQRLRGCTDG